MRLNFKKNGGELCILGEKKSFRCNNSTFLETTKICLVKKKYCLLRRNDKYQVWPGQEMKTGAKSSRARKLIYTAVLLSFYPSYHLKSVPNCQGQLSNLLLPKLPLGICTQWSKFQKLTKGILPHIPVQGPGPAVFEISIY